MNAAIRELRDAEATMNKTWEGTLSQQGGDCPVSLSCVYLNITLAFKLTLISSTGAEDISNLLAQG